MSLTVFEEAMRDAEETARHGDQKERISELRDLAERAEELGSLAGANVLREYANDLEKQQEATQ